MSDPTLPSPLRAARPFAVFRRLVVAAAFGIGICSRLSADVAAPLDSFVRITDDQGLTHSDVRAIAQDQEGFIWFGMRIGGLARYDGYELKTYQHDPTDPHSLGHQVIWSLLVDRTGTLWIGTEGGLARFDRKTDSFVHFRHDPARPDSIANDVVVCLFEDLAGKLWAGTRVGLCRLDDRERGVFTTFLRPQVVAGSSAKDTYRSIIQDPTTGLLWLGASDGLAAFDPKTGAFASFVHDPSDPESLSRNAVNKVIRDGDGVFWAMTEHGLNSFIPRFDRVATHRVQQPKIAFRRYELPNTSTSPGVNFVRDGLIDRKDRLWLATRGGLQLFDRKTGKFTSFRRKPADRMSLSDDITHTVFEDRSGNIWIGTYAGGVSRLRSEAKPFRVDSHDPTNPRSVTDDRITGLAFDAAGRLWAATTAGLCRLDPDGWTRFQHDPADPTSLPINDFSTVAAAPNGDVWIGTHYGGVYRFDGQRFHVYPTSPSNLPAPTGIQPFTGGQVNSIMADHRGGVWLGARSYGLDYLRDGRFHHYHASDGTSPGHPTFNALLGVIAPNDDVWFATENHGVVRFEPATERFTAFRAPLEPTGGGSARNLHYIARSRDGFLWLGAADGLLKFDPRGERFVRQYSTADGLPTNAVMTIVEDRRGHLWIATANGLADFDPTTERFRVYDKPDGLPSNVFSQRAGALGPDGRVYFGTRAGIVSFAPGELRDNPEPPAVALTELRWLDENRSVEGSGGAAPKRAIGDTLHVAPGRLGFSLKFAALDYATPEKNRYRYRLEGLDTRWTATSARERTATYTSLPPGRYTFRVQASNADGVWNERGASLRVIVAPHFWETTWFRATLALIGAGLIVSGLQWRLRAIRRRNTLLEEQVTQRTAELKNEIVVREGAEAALRESHGELERRVRERTAELAASNANLQAEITERKHIEDQLRQSQKMEAIGQLAGGVAHDFNNLLTIILGQSELLNMDGLPPETRGDAIRDIKGAAQRAAKLTRQLLVFSRHESMHLAAIDLNAVVAGEIELLRRLIGEHIALETSLAAGPLGVFADASMLQQVLLNLALNGRDAMPHGGRLTLATAAVSLRTGDPARGPHAQPGNYVRVSVSDTGTGIPPELLSRIFEPFFTTKERGKGTGLGLAISHGIVHQHRGWIDVETGLGKGTTFHAWLPLHALSNTAVIPETRDAAPKGAGAIVLVVEDEKEVRSVATRVLKWNGYRVIEAGCGAEALEQWSRHREEVSILLTDIVMPGAPNGRDLARRLLQDKPSLQVVMMSGYDPGEVAERMGDGNFPSQHLRKPFTTMDLLRALPGQKTS